MGSSVEGSGEGIGVTTGPGVVSRLAPISRVAFVAAAIVQLGWRLRVAPTPAVAMAADLNDGVGMSGSPESSETIRCNGMITIVRAVGVHPKIVDPLIAAAFACLLLLLLDAAVSVMSSCGLHCVHVFAR